jgi:hypothetical protein
MNFSQKLTTLTLAISLCVPSVVLNADSTHSTSKIVVQPAEGTTKLDVNTTETYIPYRELPQYKTPYSVTKASRIFGGGAGLLLGHSLLDLIPYYQEHVKKRAAYWAKQGSDWAWRGGPGLELPTNASFSILRKIACYGFLAGAAALFAKGAFAEDQKTDCMTEEHLDSIHMSKIASLAGLAATGGVIAYKCLTAAGLLPAAVQ